MYLVGLKVGPGVYAEAAAAVGVVAGDDGGREGVHKDLSGVHSSDIQDPTTANAGEGDTGRAVAAMQC